MKKSRLLVAIAIALLSAALLAGCGGVSKADYEKDVKKVATKVEKDLDKLDSGTPTAKDLDTAQKTLESAADDLEDIDPPSEVEDLHDDLVETLNDTAKLMDKMAPLMDKASKDPTSLGEKELEQMNEITTEFGDIEKRMSKIEAGYKKKKYSVGLDS
jgi:predicted  nucleic acid-binding Zn-ribbon protein